MDLREDNRKPKRTARSRARTRLIEEDAETEYSYGSLENSGTESSLHGDESSTLGDTTPAREVSAEPSTSSRSKEDEKKCAFCWRGKKSSLGQGILIKCEPTVNFNPFRKSLKGRQNSSEQDASKRRNRGEQSKSPRRFVETGKYANVYNELSDVGLPHHLTIADVFDEPDRAVYAHHCCAAWSDGVLQAEDYSLQFVDKAVCVGLNSKCSFCDKFGATIPCKGPKCNKKFHYPCASGSGCFQDVKTVNLLCTDHCELAEATAKDESHCVVCSEPGNILRQLFCTSCGQHYHGDCLEFEIECNSVVRAGWQCPECKLCQECRNPGDDNKMLVCDVCDKGFHTFCLNPAISKVPPNGWRCHNCRSCVECGLNSPQTRWYKNYTVCEPCHQYKQRGASCPVCKKAYKIGNTKGMAMCIGCKRYVHSHCDKDMDKADTKGYHCSSCHVPAASSAVSSPAANTKVAVLTPEAPVEDAVDDTDRHQFESDSETVESEKMNTSSSSSKVRPVKPGKGKPASFTRGKVGIKKPPTKSSRSAVSSGTKSKGKVMKRRSRPAATERRANRTKIKETIATTHSAAPSAESVKKMDDDDHHAAVVLAATSDLFVLTQDMCMSCGSYGADGEGNLITCTQCGQCYHPFCAQVKVNQVILTKGWRCLDCTVCEGCGKPTDEPNLLLCDECDISFHTYCLDPPLAHVPKGNWKCKWCVHCRYCGSASPGFGCEWINNYTECAPCHSVTDCPVCEDCYIDNELVIQCNKCERWLHASCDNMKTEDDTERMSNLGYHCLFCRPQTGSQSPRPPTPEPATPASIMSPLAPAPLIKEEEKSYSVDGVYLSENGLGLIKELTLEAPVSQYSIAQKAALAARLAKNRQLKIKQSHPQMTQLLSVASATSELPTEEDATSNNADDLNRPVADVEPDTSLAGSESVLSPTISDIVKTESWQAPAAGGDNPQAAAEGGQLPEGLLANVDSSKAKRRTRKPPPLGIGGFVAKPRQRGPPKPIVQGPLTADGQPPLLIKEPEQEGPADAQSSDPTKKKIVRKLRKKGIIEDTYPVYLQEAFFGKETLEHTKSGTPSQEDAPTEEPNIALTDEVPDGCTIKLPENITIPPPQPFPNILEEVADPDIKEGNADDIPPIDGDDLDILPGVPGDILPGGLHEEELYKIFDDIQSEAAEGRDAGPSDSKSSLRATDEQDMEIDAQNLEDFLKGIMENDASAEAAAGVLSELPVDTADHVPDPMVLGQVMDPMPQAMPLPLPLQQQQLTRPPMHLQHQAPPQQLQQVQHQAPPQQLQQVQHQTPPQQLQQVQHQAPPQQLQQVQHQVPMPDPFNMSLQTAYTAAPPPTVQPGPEYHQPGQQQLVAVPSSVASSLPSSHPGTPFGASSFSEPNWPNPSVPGGSGVDPDDGEHMSLNQKNMLKWKDDEPLGLDATISPVLFANTIHPELKQEYPDWAERCKQIGKYWRKMNTEQRNPYLQKARENRHKRSRQNKNARKKQMKDSPLGSPRGAGMSPGSGTAMKGAESSSSDTGIPNIGDPSFPVQPQGPGLLPNNPPGVMPAGMDPYSRPVPTPGLASAPSTPADADSKVVSQGSISEHYRQESYPGTPFAPDSAALQQGPDFTGGPGLEAVGVPLPDSAHTDDPSLSSSFPGPFTKRLTMLSQRVQSQDKQSHLNVVNKQQLLAGLGMNTEDVRKQHLRELLIHKPGDQSVGAEAMGWHSGANLGNPNARRDFAAPRGPPSGYPAQRVWSPLDNSAPPGAIARPQYGVRPEGWNVGPLQPGQQHMMRPPPRNRYPRMELSPQAMYRARGPGTIYPGRFQGPPHMMVDGSRMPTTRMTQPLSLPPYPDAYQARLAQPGRMMEGAGHTQLGPSPDHISGRPGEPDQGALDDLLCADNLLPLSDPVLDETLADFHDKNMFDEHLGLKKELETTAQAEQSQLQAHVKHEPLAASSDPHKTEYSKGGKMTEKVSSSASTANLSSATTATEVYTPATAQPETTLTTAFSLGALTLASTTVSTASCTSTYSQQTKAGSQDILSTTGSGSATESVSSTSVNAASPRVNSRPASAIGSPRVAMIGGSPHASVASSPLSMGQSMVPGSPHPHASVAPLVPGSPHPLAAVPLVPGSPHPHAAVPLMPGSPHPHVSGSLVPGSPHPYATGPVIPGSPHPQALIPGAGSPHPHVGPLHGGNSPHPHSYPGAGMVPGSPRPGVLMPHSPHPGMPQSHQAMSGGSPLASIISGSPHQKMAVHSPASASGMEQRPFSRQGSVEQTTAFQMSPSVGRMMSGPQYPGGSPMHHIPMSAAPAVPASTAAKPAPYRHPTPGFTSQHHQMHGQLRPPFGGMPGNHGDMAPASPFNRMMDPRAGHALHDMVEEEKRLQQQVKPDMEGEGRSAPAVLLSEQDFEKLRADVVNDPSSSSSLPQTSPRNRFDPQQSPDVWHPGHVSGNMGGEFHPPPPPPYPGTGRATPGQMRPAYPTDHRASAMPPMPPQSPGPRMPGMHGPGTQEMRFDDILRAKDMELTERISLAEKELNAAKKRKKQLLNKQKTAKKANEELNAVDAQYLEKVTQDIGLISKSVEALKNEHKNHQRAMHEFTIKNQERMMQWGGGHMMQRHAGPYPGGMMPPRMRGMYNPSRPIDPRQIEFERIQQQRMQMMHGAGPRPGMHPMQRPPYVEGSMDMKAAMFGVPRFGGMSIRPTMKPDGSEPTEEERRRFMMIQYGGMPRPGMRPMHPEMTARMHQPNQMPPRMPAVAAESKAKSKESAGIQRQKSLPAPKSSTSAPSLKQTDKGKDKEVEDAPEKSSLHTASIPISFPGQQLCSLPKPIVSAVPFMSGTAKNVPTAIEDMPKTMTALGNQYPLKLIKAEPKLAPPAQQKEKEKETEKEKEKKEEGSANPIKKAKAEPTVSSAGASKSTSKATHSSSAVDVHAIGADGTSLIDRMVATIHAVALAAGEMADREEAEARLEADKLVQARTTPVAASSASSYSHMTMPMGPSPHHLPPRPTGPAQAGAPGVMGQPTDALHRSGIPVSVVTTNTDKTLAVSTAGQISGGHPPPHQTTDSGAGHGAGRKEGGISDSNALLKRLLENVKPNTTISAAPDSSRSRLAAITPEEQRQREAEQLQMGADYHRLGPEQPRMAPEQPRMASEQSRMAPEQHRMGPEQHRMGPEQHRMGPEQHRMGPEQHRMGPELHQMGVYGTPAHFDAYPWNPQTGFSPEQWATLPKKEKQHIYEARMTPNGQIIADNGTIISVPNQPKPSPQMNMGSLGNLGNMGAAGALKSGPLHAMQHMRSAITGEPKKKRPPQGDKKRKGKASAAAGTPSTAVVPPAVVTGPPAPPPASAQSEPVKLYEELKQKLRTQPQIQLQEPELNPKTYTSAIQPVRTVRSPNQRIVIKPKAPNLAGSYGRSCIEGRCDVYSYLPYTNTPIPVLKPSPGLPADTSSKKAGAAKPSRTSEAAQSSEGYDISRFQQVMSKSQMVALSLPSPPLLRLSDKTSFSMSPPLIVEPSFIDIDAEQRVSTDRERRDADYPYLKPIKDSSADQMLAASACDGRLSPDIPLCAPVPVKVSDLGYDPSYLKLKREAQSSALEKCNKDPFGPMAEEELKSTAVGIQSSLQSAIRESPSNQVSVTLTLTSEAAQDIPNVLTKLADLLRMAAPPSYQLTSTDPADDEKMSADDKPHYCRHCDVVIAAGQAVVRRLSDLPVSGAEDKEEVTGEKLLHFCAEECLLQYSMSRQSASSMAKDPSNMMIEHKAAETKAASLPPSKNNPKKAKKRVNETPAKPSKKWKEKRWRRWAIKVTFHLHKYDPPTEDEIKTMMSKVGQLVKPDPSPTDTRRCILCQQVGDGHPDIASRLLNHDVDRWVHLNCALWSAEVYETLNGALINLDNSVKRGSHIQCVVCKLKGATLGCFRQRCPNVYHVACAHRHRAMFFQDKTVLCPVHMPTESPDQLKQLTVNRKVYINRDESLQIANAVRCDEKQCSVRIGAVVYYSIGQLFTHQILTGRFHTRDYIYPVGYRCVRFFWSTRYPNRRCCYECAINEGEEGAPVFVIVVKERGHSKTRYTGHTPKEVWANILDVVESQRRHGDFVKIFPEFLSGEYMFGLKEPSIIRIIESLPGTELLANYAFKFGKTQLIEMPPAINPTGCARSEPKLRTHFRKPHTLQASSPRSHVLPTMTTVALPGDVNSPYHKQFVHSKSQQYRKLKTEWRNYVYLGRSRIQGLGMYAARDIEKHTMVIEYIGEVIRNELAEHREKIYDAHNRGVYMFRITPDFVIDATMSGGPARYINHSCDPNCVTETVTMDKDVKIVIIALRRITKGEELNYDYKFDLEDDSSKIPCNCGASNCRKWMN